MLFHITLSGSLGAVSEGFRLLRDFLQRYLRTGFGNHIDHRCGNQRHRADRIVIAGNRYRDQIRICIGIDNSDHRNAEFVRLRDGDTFALRIHHEQRSREPPHPLDTLDIASELGALPFESQPFLLGEKIEGPFVHPLLDFLEAANLLLDCVKIRERPAEPSLSHEERLAAFGLRPNNLLELSLGADKQDPVAAQYYLADLFLR